MFERKKSENFFEKKFFDPKKSKIFTPQKRGQNGQNGKIWPNCRFGPSVWPTTPIWDENLEKSKIAHFDPILGGFDPKNGVKIAKMSKFGQIIKSGHECKPHPNLRRFGRKLRKLMKEKPAPPKTAPASGQPYPFERLASVADQTKS